MGLMPGEHTGRILYGLLGYNFSIKPRYRDIDCGCHTARQLGAPNSAGNQKTSVFYVTSYKKEFEAIGVFNMYGVVDAVIGAAPAAGQDSNTASIRQTKAIVDFFNRVSITIPEIQDYQFDSLVKGKRQSYFTDFISFAITMPDCPELALK